jgi:putative nucleotidyltransferase with HDIG domain
MEYEFPDERLPANKKVIMLPCPNCKGIIAIRPDKSKSSVPSSKDEAKGGDENIPVGESPADGTALKEKILRSLKDLPPMPQVAQKAREVMAKPSSSFSDLAKVIETDQAIVTRILKIANSPYYGLSGKVSSVQHAAVILGSKTLMEMLNLACSTEILGKTLTGYNLDAGDLWVHSLAVAAGSQIIAKRVSPELEQDAFSAGLIHDVGKLILDPYIQERKDTFQAFVDEGNETFLNAEKHILGFDHAELAAEACRKWQIPSKIAAAIRYHHDPVKDDILSFIVHTADAVAMMSGIGSGLDGMLYTLNPEAMKVLKLEPDDLSIMMGQVAEFVEKTTQGI